MKIARLPGAVLLLIAAASVCRADYSVLHNLKPGSYLCSAEGGGVLYSPGELVAPKGRYKLQMQNVGNLVLTDFEASHGSETYPWTSGILVPGSRFRLAMQSDGNLVVYAVPAGTAGFRTGTARVQTNCYLVVQDDGNFLIYRDVGGGRGVPIWSGRKNYVTTASGGPGWIESGQSIYSPQGLYHAKLDGRGGVAIYRTENGEDSPPIWRSGKQGKEGTWYLVATPQGFVVRQDLDSQADFLYSTTAVYPNRPGGGYYQLNMQDDGNLVCYHPEPAGDFAVWDSSGNTAQKLTQEQNAYNAAQEKIAKDNAAAKKAAD